MAETEMVAFATAAITAVAGGLGAAAKSWWDRRGNKERTDAQASSELRDDLLTRVRELEEAAKAGHRKHLELQREADETRGELRVARLEMTHLNREIIRLRERILKMGGEISDAETSP